jgi:hypothetical protein
LTGRDFAAGLPDVSRSVAATLAMSQTSLSAAISASSAECPPSSGVAC